MTSSTPRVSLRNVGLDLFCRAELQCRAGLKYLRWKTETTVRIKNEQNVVLVHAETEQRKLVPEQSEVEQAALATDATKEHN